VAGTGGAQGQHQTALIPSQEASPRFPGCLPSQHLSVFLHISAFLTDVAFGCLEDQSNLEEAGYKNTTASGSRIPVFS